MEALRRSVREWPRRRVRTTSAGDQGIETATVGSEGVVGALSGFGSPPGLYEAVVQAPLVASRISSKLFPAAVQKSETLRNLMARYTEALLAQVQQTAACNALHAMESRLARWVL